MIKMTQVNQNSFASGYHFYKMFWVFLISSVLGFAIESLFCLLRYGYIESRAGLIYGPFSQIYGFGAVIMVLILHRINIKRELLLFFASAFLGGLFEYSCSLIQEFAFGFISWDYSNSQFSIFGRTNLLYCFFWGILGVVLIKDIYPFMSHQIEKIPNKIGVIISWALLVFILFDFSISAVATSRANQRFHGIPASNYVQTILDQYYPDSVLKKIYPNMIHVN
ncbi:MAG: putative ABC transporter permease [Desulfosporosinus sp.]|nr:putative ABC transporter permease [Desulfosporosinus sp.]